MVKCRWIFFEKDKLINTIIKEKILQLILKEIIRKPYC